MKLKISYFIVLMNYYDLWFATYPKDYINENDFKKILIKLRNIVNPKDIKTVHIDIENITKKDLDILQEIAAENNLNIITSEQSNLNTYRTKLPVYKIILYLITKNDKLKKIYINNSIIPIHMNLN